MIRHVLVGTDGSRYAEGAARYAVWAARAAGTKLIGCYVLDIRLLDGPFFSRLAAMLGFAPATDFRAAAEPVLRGLGETALGFIAELARKAGVAYEEVIATGPVATTLVEMATRADLVVIGRQGDHAEYENDMLGSVAEGVLKRVNISIMLAPADYEKPSRTVVLLDERPSSLAALRFACELPDEYGLFVIHERGARSAAEGLAENYGRRAEYEELAFPLEERVAQLDPSELVICAGSGPERPGLNPRTQRALRDATGPFILTA
ncbi:MAG TPA: universal stress protein [Candidatus Coatesbacteria bacterium]|nr:universal stress protein [Candidatus Coatesbacteria bacterium]